MRIATAIALTTAEKIIAKNLAEVTVVTGNINRPKRYKDFRTERIMVLFGEIAVCILAISS